MKDIFIYEDAKKKDIARLLRTYMKHTIIGRPVYTLAALIEKMTADELKHIMRLGKIPGYSKFSKKQLIEFSCCILTHRGILETILSCLDWYEWNFFKKAAMSKELNDEIALAREYNTLNRLCLVQSFFNKGSMIYVVPKEIRTLFYEMVQDGTAETIETTVLLNSCALAAANLYGILSVEEFADIFNQQNGMHLTAAEISLLLKENCVAYNDYSIEEGKLLHQELAGENLEEAKALEEIINGIILHYPL